MVAKKKSKRKQTTAKKRSGARAVSTKKPAKKVGAGKGTAARKSAGAKKPTRKAPRKKKTAAKPKAIAKKIGKKKLPRSSVTSAPERQGRHHSPAEGLLEFPLGAPVRRRGAQAGDLQGLSSGEGVNSESVEELLEEGNAFEAGAITGVEDAEDSGTSEVHTHEVPEDDVPQEYLDKE